jgi:NADPH:quinone reductase-like Zn-dependent oxidoreductase
MGCLIQYSSAVRLFEIRQPAGTESLVLTEKPNPVPGPFEVVVRIRAASLNYRDLVAAKGGYGRSLRLPLVPLSDGAGEVIATGSGVTRVKHGDRVAGIFMQKWLSGELTESVGRSALGGAIDGVLAEQVVFHEDGLVHVPAHLTWEEGACLPCAGVTAWHALAEAGRIRPGETVLTLGTGGVSIFALQFARAAGARVIATTSSEVKAQRLRELGAALVINYKTVPEWSRAVREFTAGAGADHVVEVGGAGTLEQSLRAVRWGGLVSFIGVLAAVGNFNPNWIFMKGVRLQGIYVGSRAMFEAMNRAVTASELRPVIDKVFSFEEAPAAYRHIESGAHFGKVCLRV